VSYNGITPASQADNEGSIPFTRSSPFQIQRQDAMTRDAAQIKAGPMDRFFYARHSAMAPAATPYHCRENLGLRRDNACVQKKRPWAFAQDRVQWLPPCCHPAPAGHGLFYQPATVSWLNLNSMQR
jgi:hypothetical protein